MFRDLVMPARVLHLTSVSVERCIRIEDRRLTKTDCRAMTDSGHGPGEGREEEGSEDERARVQAVHVHWRRGVSVRH